MIRLIFTFCLQFLLAGSGQARVVRGNASMISDGIMNNEMATRSSVVLSLESSTVTCTPTYGFLPCTTVIWGNLFLIVVYEYLLALSQKYITEGSNLFFKMFGTGIFGASMFQILGTFPPVMILLGMLFQTTERIQRRRRGGLDQEVWVVELRSIRSDLDGCRAVGAIEITGSAAVFDDDY